MSLFRRKRRLLGPGWCRLWTYSENTDLVDRPLRKVVALRLQVQRAEGLLVLRQILSQHVPQGLGLLRAQEDGLVVANRYLVGAGARSQAEDQLEVPNAHAHLHAIGIGLAVVGGLGKVQLRLLCRWTHGYTRLLPPEPGRSPLRKQIGRAHV